MNKIMRVIVIMLVVAILSASASAQTFGKGTKVYDKNGKCLGKLPCKMNLEVIKEEKTQYKVKGKGKFSGQIGYIKKSDALSNNAGLTYEEEDSLHGYFVNTSCANVRNANGDIIGKLKGGTEINFIKYSTSPTLGGTFVKFHYKGGYGYVYAGLVSRG